MTILEQENGPSPLSRPAVVTQAQAQRTTACSDCGAVQGAPDALRGGSLVCAVCGSEIDRMTGRSLDAALACAAATFLLLIPANLLPFLTTSVLGVSRQSRLISSARAMWEDGWPWLGVAVALFLVVFPLVRFALLTLVLGALRLGRRPPWLGRAFRYANFLQMWAMSDVFLLGLWVAYARLSATIAVTVGAGCICFILAGLLTLFTRATLPKAQIWEAISPDRPAPAEDGDVLACQACDLLLPATCEGQPCPRCQATAHARKPQAVSRAAALTLAGVLLYLPANLYPIATLPINLQPTKYTVLEGVKDLFQAHLPGLGLLVFCASFAIPLFKLVGLSWCIVSVLRRSDRHLVLKTRLYGVVEEIGRWSMVDPFVIACFVPVMQYNDLIYGRAEPAAPAFTAVVILTMIAARCFDPRLMWDAPRRRV